MSDSLSHNKPQDIEIQIFMAIFSTIFVFLGFLLSIPENSVSFESSFSPMFLPYKITVYQSIRSNLLLSFILLFGAILLYFTSKKDQISNGYRFCAYLGAYYWICLVTNVIYLVDLKYSQTLNAEIILLNIWIWLVGYIILKIFFIYKVFPLPQFEGKPDRDKIIWIIIYLMFWSFWVNNIVPNPDSIFSPFNYLWTPYVVMMILTILASKLVQEIESRYPENKEIDQNPVNQEK